MVRGIRVGADLIRWTNQRGPDQVDQQPGSGHYGEAVGSWRMRPLEFWRQVFCLRSYVPGIDTFRRSMGSYQNALMAAQKELKRTQLASGYGDAAAGLLGGQ